MEFPTKKIEAADTPYESAAVAFYCNYSVSPVTNSNSVAVLSIDDSKDASFWVAANVTNAAGGV